MQNINLNFNFIIELRLLKIHFKMTQQMKIISVFFFLTSVVGNYFAQTGTPVTETSKPFVLGTIEEIVSVRLNEKRILNIYLPEGYNENDSLKYPVIYLLDGSADEDFIHVVGLIQFNNFPWIDRVPKSIVVGIANVDRKRDFTYPTTLEEDKKRYPTTGHSDNFIGFLEEELQPYIATEILFKKPELFDKYIIISPSIWWDNGSLLNQSPAILQETFAQKTDIYIGVGKEGLTPGDFPRVMETDANLLTEKIRGTKNKQVQVHFDYLPDEDHATVTHQAIFNALRMLYPVSEKRE